MSGMTSDATASETWAPEILVRVYRGDHLIDQRFSNDPETAARNIEYWEAQAPPAGTRIVVDPHPPEAIIALLRAIADALEEERPVAMRHPFPHVRLELATEGTEPTSSRRGQLRLIFQELAHPGD
jgi:hypothetical protein